MVDSTKVMSDFAKVMTQTGMPISVKYYTRTYSGSDYDDVATDAQSGTTVWTSGIVQPITFRGVDNSQQNVLLQQGLIKFSDKTLYVKSGLSLGEDSVTKVEIGIGSPNRDVYSILPEGVLVPFELNGEWVYQKAFIRRLTTGTIQDE